jgi:hypothetical protein
VLRLMIEDAGRWWTAADIRGRWRGSQPAGPAIGMAMRSLSNLGMLERDHGPPASYQLNAEGREAAREL